MDIRTTTPGRRAVLTAGAGLAAAAVVGVERLWPGANQAAHDAAFRTVADTTTGCTTLTPTVTEGPFWVDERLNRSDLRSDRDGTDVQSGVPLTFTMTLVDAGDGCTPQEGAYVDVWHANAQGAYSAVSGMGNPDNRAYDWLRGYQVSDADGKVTFTTIWPGYYRGRTIHLHFRIRTALDDATVNFTSQLFMDETNNALVLGTEAYQQQSARDTTNAQDSIYLASLLMPVTGSTLAGYTGSFTVNLDFQDADVTPTPTASPTPTETATPSPTTPTATPTPTTTPADTVVQAAATSGTVYRRGRRRRARMSWTNAEKVSATIRLRRGDDVLAQHHLGRVGHGKHSSVLSVPSSVTAGRARLEIVVKDAAGNVKILRRTVTVPR